MSDTKTIIIHHSPDADDAFMFYGLTSGAVSIPGYRFEHELNDIETLNKRTLQGELDVTAVSVHAFAYLKDQYVILDCGASMGGKDYGPRLVVPKGSSDDLSALRRVAIPGKHTSAALAFSLFLKSQGLSPALEVVYFDKIEEVILAGEVDGGVLIHEGQLTHPESGLKMLVDLGQWWWEQYELPLPLGVNVARKALGDDAISASEKALHRSISFSLENRSAALDYALSYGRGLSQEDADLFVSMYVNEWTLSLGKKGRASIELFLKQGREQGIITSDFELAFSR